MISLISFTLVACGTTTEEETDTSANEEQTEDSANVDEEGNVQVAEVQVDVSSDVTEAVDQVDEAVVSVVNMQEVDLGAYGDFFFSEAPQESEESLMQAGTGSGVIYKTEGNSAYLVTNNHVVEGSDAINVILKDGTQVEANIIGADEWTDLAVLEIDAGAVTQVADFGDSSNLTVGEPAIAIGSPLGTEFASSVTAGIVSAKDRQVPVDVDGDGQVDWETTAIQTDAAINPGNSGGALVNIAGQVIGINSMKISSSSVEGMGFAIPSNEVVNIVNQLEENGEVVRPFLGVTQIDLSYFTEEQRANELNLPEDVTEGVVVVEVQPGTSAATADIQPGDTIVSYNGESVTSPAQLRQYIYSTPVGETAEIELYRNGEPATVQVTMQPAEAQSF